MAVTAPFMTIDAIRQQYGIKSRNTIYMILGEMERCKRYKNVPLRLDRLVNAVAMEDFLEHRKDLKHKTSASKNLPPFSMYTARRKRGDLNGCETYNDDPHEPLEKEENEACYLYYILNEEKDKVKIGISNNPMSRAKSLQTASGEDLEILKTIKFGNREDAFAAEQFLHNEFSQFRKKPTKISKQCEWFASCIVENLLLNYTDPDAILKMAKSNE